MRFAHSAEMAWEAGMCGGLAAMVFVRDLEMTDLPNDMPPHIRAFVRQLVCTRVQFREVEKYLERAAQEYTSAEG